MLAIPVLKVIKFNEFSKPNKNCGLLCISLKQWAILCSILIFIFMAIITTCTVLGTLHTKQLLHLLADDIEDERDKHRYDFVDRPRIISSNEIRLQQSQAVVLSFSKILSISMWMSWLNLFLAALLIYGVTTMTAIYILPWIFLSGTTYLLALTTAIMTYLKIISGLYISHALSIIFGVASVIFILMWSIIFIYYLNLTRRRCSRGDSLTPTIIQAYGGYTHSILPAKNIV